MINLPKILNKLAIKLIRVYQILLSPLLGFNKCRFHPTCSRYMIEAIEKKGFLKGFFMGVCRLLKCHPFSKKDGFDPIK